MKAFGVFKIISVFALMTEAIFAAQERSLSQELPTHCVTMTKEILL
ncbi:MAG: hypothetical protein JWQ35_212, partial [Bacteriovoracaceae bacterium]|nr:hypothetical protein [Bacteriovoracaceae bacterium]